MVHTPSPSKYAPYTPSKTLVPVALGFRQEVGREANGPSPGFLLTQSDFLSEVIKELPSLHPVGTEGL